MKYAMICNGKVIDVVQSKKTPYFPPTPEGYEIISVQIDEELKVSSGMSYIDGEFIGDYIEENPSDKLTQLDIIEQAVKEKNEEIRQHAIDAYTLELLEGGIL